MLSTRAYSAVVAGRKESCSFGGNVCFRLRGKNFTDRRKMWKHCPAYFFPCVPFAAPLWFSVQGYFRAWPSCVDQNGLQYLDQHKMLETFLYTIWPQREDFTLSLTSQNNSRYPTFFFFWFLVLLHNPESTFFSSFSCYTHWLYPYLISAMLFFSALSCYLKV